MDRRLAKLTRLSNRVKRGTADLDRRIALVRELKLEGYSVAELAEASGMSDKWVYKVLDGIGTAKVGRGANKP